MKNGLVQISPEGIRRNRAEAASAVSISDYVWSKDSEPAAINWNGEFDALAESRIELIDALSDRGICLHPWRIFDALPKNRKKTNRLFWNQGPIPSCSMHAAAHATECAVLTEMGLGASIVYDALNPIYPFYIARGGNLSGGVTIYDTAKQLNEGGQFAVSDVGDDNQNVDQRSGRFGEWKQRAKSRQCAVVYLENNLVDRIFTAAHAGFYVVFGSNSFWNSSAEDRNGVKVMKSETHGGHAECLGTWRKVGNTEYVFLYNSHGDIYGSSDECEPKTGAWVTRDQVSRLSESMEMFGLPFIVLPENPDKAEPSLVNDFEASFPHQWKV